VWDVQDGSWEHPNQAPENENAKPTLRTTGQDLSDHSTVHIGQAKIPACVAAGQSLTIKTQQMEHGGMQVMDGNGLFGCLETKVIGGSVGRAHADPSPCHPKGEVPMILIPPLGGHSSTLIHFDRTRPNRE